MSLLKKSALALCLGVMVATSGMAVGAELTVQEQYQQFLKDKPSFRTQKTGLPAVDTVFSSVAQLCELQYKDLQAMDDVTQKNLAGYQIFVTLEKLQKEENGEKKVKEYVSKLKKREVAALDNYLKYATEVNDRMNARLSTAVELGASVYAAAKLDRIQNANFLQKAQLLLAVKRATSQVDYALEASKWARAFDATLKNVQSSRSR